MGDDEAELAEPAVDEHSESIWVHSELTADGAYRVGVHVGQDTSWVMDEPEALAHAREVLRIAQTADHDAGVVRLLLEKLSLEREDAAFMLRQLRQDRPAQSFEHTDPLRVRPRVGGRSLRPYLTLICGGRHVGHWTLGDATAHAFAVLEAVATVDLDTALYRQLRGLFDLEDGPARGIIDDLRRYRVGGNWQLVETGLLDDPLPGPSSSRTP